MNIDNDHMYHGAALMQIAEHPKFTSINSLKVKKQIIENGFVINDGIAVLLKYASKQTGKYQEYKFGFTLDNIKDMMRISRSTKSLYLALVCVESREICCLSYENCSKLIQRRRAEKGADEDQYQILVTAPKGKSLRVYVNAPGVKKKLLGEPMIVGRSEFPEMIFG